MKKSAILSVLVIATTAFLFLIGRPSFVRGGDAAGIKITKISEEYPAVQILDEARRIVCYTYSTPAGTSISCAKY